MKILLKNATVLTEKGLTKADLLTAGKRIESIGTGNRSADKIIDCKGKTVLAGLIDMHCHLREPGFEHKETILSGLSAATAGGFTAVCPMPNTRPVTDNATVVRYVRDEAAKVNLAKVYPIGAISKGQEGKELSEILSMRREGIVAVSDDGCPVENANLMRLCLEYVRPYDMLTISHCEEKSLAAGGWVNEGKNSLLSGLKGIPAISETVMAARDILIAEYLNAKIHIAHVSAWQTVQIIREAKKRGVRVTAETCPHYIAGDDGMILGYDTDAKVNPPLKTQRDRDAVIEGLIDGTIDVIATDHAPHHRDEKNVEFAYAPFGISGFETAFALCYTELVKGKKMTLNRLGALMSENPACILGLESGVLSEGRPADLVVIDLDGSYRIDPQQFLSKGKNNPFAGKEVFGKIELTMVDGIIKYQGGKII